MANLEITESSKNALRTRMASAEGKVALDQLAKIIAEAAFNAMSEEQTATFFGTPDGMEAFKKLWPDIVTAFLFRPLPQKTRSASRGGGKTLHEPEHGPVPSPELKAPKK